MYRYSPVRNQRSKGIKIKHVLQVCLLVAVCFWLIFQVKRSHEKKKEFDSKIPSSIKTQSSDEMATFGRKDLKPKVEETTKEVDIHEEEEEDKKLEEEEQDHDEENKHEEEDREDEKIEEEKDDRGGGGDDEIDENEHEKLDVEIDREEMENVDEEKETEEIEEKENEEKEEQIEAENEGSSDDHDEDGTTVHTHEAREEHYKADDASSAVTHDSRTLGSEKENVNGTLDDSSDDSGLVDNGETIENGTSANLTMIQEEDSESMAASLNPTTSIESREDGPPSSTTTNTSESTQSQNITERLLVSGDQDGNLTIESSNSTNISDDSESDESMTEEKETDSIKPEKETEEGEDENIRDETEESVDPDEVQHDTIDFNDPLRLEEKEVRNDLDTLPEIETEGGNGEDTAVE